MFLHDRNTCGDLACILRENRSRFSNGVVHSFTGTREELDEMLDLGLYIGINGCSLKTEENLNVAAAVPLERLMLETDAPWCSVRPTHAGHKFVKSNWSQSSKPCKHKPHEDEHKCVKGRSEPCHMR